MSPSITVHYLHILHVLTCLMSKILSNLESNINFVDNSSTAIKCQITLKSMWNRGWEWNSYLVTDVKSLYNHQRITASYKISAAQVILKHIFSVYLCHYRNATENLFYLSISTANSFNQAEAISMCRFSPLARFISYPHMPPLRT